MNEVKRYSAALTQAETSPMYEAPDGEWVAALDFDRLTAERDALQQRLNAEDQRNDDLSGLLQGLIDNPFRFNDAYRARIAVALDGQSAADQRIDELERGQDEPVAWIIWNGGDCPVDAAAMVEYALSGNPQKVCRPDNAFRLDWRHDHRPSKRRSNIIKYRIYAAPTTTTQPLR